MNFNFNDSGSSESGEKHAFFFHCQNPNFEARLVQKVKLFESHFV